jgi:nucleotide-binding universal stress UspA family protein
MSWRLAKSEINTGAPSALASRRKLMGREFDSELLMERPTTSPEAQQSGIKTILFHVHDDDQLMDRLQVALSFARACGAHLHCLHVTPIEAYAVVDAYGGTFVNAQIVEALEERGQMVRRDLEAHLAKEDVTWDYEEITGELLPRLVQGAALADLVVTGREPKQREFGGPAVTLLGDLIGRVRTPLLVVGGNSVAADPLGAVVIAWNGSYEAANAVRSAVPLLRMASNVRVVRFTENKDELFPSTTLLEYLSRQGVHAELDVRPEPRDGIEAGIVEYALGIQASAIVMGGYSHSRAGEFLFGGVTRELLKSCELPLFLSR